MNQDRQIAEIIKKMPSSPASIYLLMGEEPYFVDYLSDHIENNLLPEEDRAFNQTILYGSSTCVQEIVDCAMRFPVGADRQLIVVREAQTLDSSIDKMQHYAASPTDFTTLVLCYKGKNLDKRKALYKAISKSGVIFESPKVYESDVPMFIKEQFEKRGITLTQKSMILLLEHLGTDLTRICNEAEKLSLVLPPKSELKPEMVEKFIGISRNFNNFELQKAIAAKDAAKAMQIVKYFSTNKDSHPIATVSLLYSFFSKMIIYHNLRDKSPTAVSKALGINPFFVKDYSSAGAYYNLRQSVRAMEILREIDLKSKGVESGNISVFDIYKELVFKLLNT